MKLRLMILFKSAMICCLVFFVLPFGYAETSAPRLQNLLTMIIANSIGYDSSSEEGSQSLEKNDYLTIFSQLKKPTGLNEFSEVISGLSNNDLNTLSHIKHKIIQSTSHTLKPIVSNQNNLRPFL